MKVRGFVFTDHTVFMCACLSVGYTMDTMYFGKLPNAVDVDKDVQMPQFKLIQQFVDDCSQNYTTGTLQASVSPQPPPSPRSRYASGFHKKKLVWRYTEKWVS